MGDVRLELVMVQARLAELQGELQEPDIRGIGQSRPVLRIEPGQAGLPEARREVVQPLLRHPLQHRLHDRVVERLEQLGIDDVGLEFVRDQLEQRFQPRPRVEDDLELAEHGFLLDRLPPLQGGDQQRLA